ncbi:MAG TPA: DNA alkylation repair protein [Polyangiales bacterium]|nr:DNA alkylation repair protein [Polyangiales bacterium]
MTEKPSALLRKVRQELARIADPERAPAMQAYMKSDMPYHGLPMPLVRSTSRALFKDYAFDSAEQWQQDVLALWRGARFREERYVAIALTGDKRARAFQTMDALPMYEAMIVSGAWWDYVDEIASHRLGQLLKRFPKPMRRQMLLWSKDADMWRRRSAILCQLNFGADTDLELLYACFEPSLTSKEFFLRKAIGWALRQLARIQPEEVQSYVAAHPELSGLTQREALKHIGPSLTRTKAKDTKTSAAKRR